MAAVVFISLFYIELFKFNLVYAIAALASISVFDILFKIYGKLKV